MIPYLSLAKYKSILCHDGDLPPTGFFDNNIPIIAADGAANQLTKLGLQPALILGDLDSVKPEEFPESDIIFLLDQNKSDFAKALEYLAEKHLTPTLVTGVSGGFIDHVLNNINIILEHQCDFYTPPILGYVLKGPVVFSSEFVPNTKLSLFGMSKAIVTTHGLRWDLANALLEFPGDNSSLNRTEEAEVTIEVSEGELLVLIYTDKIIDRGIL